MERCLRCLPRPRGFEWRPQVWGSRSPRMGLRPAPAPAVRLFGTSQRAAQLEALGMVADAVGKAADEVEEGKADDGKRPRSSQSRRRAAAGAGNKPPKDEKKSSSKASSKAWVVLVKASETGLLLLTSLGLLGFAGLIYHRGYTWHTLNKMEAAIDDWDPMLEMSIAQKKIANDAEWVHRAQQKLLSDVIAGDVAGRYYILFGEKGTGKTSMLLQAIQRVKSKNVVVVDAHADPEIFRIRLGKALNFQFHEDYLGGLFSLRGPRENTAILDIERAFNVLEEVAVRRVKKLHKPLTLVINNAHLIRDDEAGTNLVELLQQKAEAFSGSGLATIIFNSDDYWLYERLKKLQTRMDMIAVSDFSKPESFHALRLLRRDIVGEDIDDSVASSVYALVGGRPQHLSAIAGHKDMISACQRLIDREKQWFLNTCGLLGGNMDDDVMDSGKFSAAAMILAREFVRMHEAEEASLVDEDGTYTLPRVPLWRARQLMTRPDFMQQFDNLNIFTLDSHSRVKPDSVVMMHAFREIVHMPGFDELLESTLDRIDDIESLGRTREVVLKDLGSGGGRVKGAYIFKDGSLKLELPNFEVDDDDESYYMQDLAEKAYWKQRLTSMPRRKKIEADVPQH